MPLIPYIKLALLCFGCLLTLFIFSVSQCIESQEAGVPCLKSLEPIIDKLFNWSAFPRQRRLEYFQQLLATVGVVIGVLGVLSLLLRRSRSAIICVLLLCALVGETLVLLSYPVWVSLTATGVALGMIALLIGVLPPNDPNELSQVKPPCTWEAMAFIPFAIVFTLLHFYLLNRVPGGWDTEGCGFRYSAHPSFRGVLLHESGMHPITTSGLSWNLAYWLMGYVDEPDLYFLYTRFLSTGLVTLKLLVMFLLLRRMTGVFPAFLGLAILGFGPPEDWWSREPFMHQLPGLVALLIIWGTIRALEMRRYRDFGLLTLLAACARFVYPSGLFFGFMPVTFFMALLIFRWSEWKRHAIKIALLFLSVGFWISWRTVAHGIMTGYWAWVFPVEIPSHSTLPTTIWEKLNLIFVRNGLDVMTAIFAQQVNPTHWTVALTWGVSRSTTSIVLVLTLIALARIIRFRSGAIGFMLLLCFAWSIFPGLMTPVADRRIGVIFAVLIIIAAREAGYLLSIAQADGWRGLTRGLKILLPPAMALYLGWISASMHFEHKGGTPHQVVRGQMFRQFIEDDALLFYVTSDGNCDVFFSLYKDLKARNCKTGWTTATYGTAPELTPLMEKPAISQVMWPYRNTELAQCFEQHKGKDWKKIIFMFADTTDVDAHIARIQSLHPGGVLEKRSHTLETGIEIRVFVYKVEKA